MRRDFALAYLGDKIVGIVVFVRAQRRARFAYRTIDHGLSRLAFCSTCSRGAPGIDDQTVTVFRQGLAGESQLRLVALALFVQPSIGIGGRAMDFVAAFLALEIDLGIADRHLPWAGSSRLFDKTLV